MKDELKFTTMINGAQYVMTAGMIRMPLLHVFSLDLLPMEQPLEAHDMVKALGRYG